MYEERIPVNILGQTYEILGDPSDALYYNSLARYVEEQMRDIQKATHIVSSQKIAVLAALNIADELFQEKEKKSSGSKNSDKKCDEILHLLDTVLENEK